VSLDEFVAEISGAAWFAACGEFLTESERDDASALAAALGFLGIAVSPVANWREAAHVTQRDDWSRAWWQREAAAEAALKQEAAWRYGAETVLEELSHVAFAASALSGAASLAMARGGVADEALARVAAGAAAQACHQAALARAAAAGADHAFAQKFRLYAGGRWPLGIVGGRLFVF
jgi:hypothetical protein